MTDKEAVRAALERIFAIVASGTEPPMAVRFACLRTLATAMERDLDAFPDEWRAVVRISLENGATWEDIAEAVRATPEAARIRWGSLLA